MGGEGTKKSKLSWSKSLVRKWLNIRGKAEDFNADFDAGRGREEETAGAANGGRERRPACSAKKSSRAAAAAAAAGILEKPLKRNTERSRRGRHEFDYTSVTEIQDCRIFSATWNVGGKPPSRHLNLDEWLLSSPPADIYVLGFQEIVPLNAGNVLGNEDNEPAKKWVALIRKTLNKSPVSCNYGGLRTPSPVPHPVVELEDDFEAGYARRQYSDSFFHRRSFQHLSRSLRVDRDVAFGQPALDRRFSVCESMNMGSRRRSNCDAHLGWDASSDDENFDDSWSNMAHHSPSYHSYSNSMEESFGLSRTSSNRSNRYCLVASKQMVGIFLTIWVRGELRNDIKNIKVSCVGRGLMGYLGNKGSISVSLSLHETTFCFVCCHLTSGQKDGDEVRRNSDVMEILRKTRFPHIRGSSDMKSPGSILEHDRIIWLGDLNYRIALSYSLVKPLVEMQNWRQLLEKDQLRMEQRAGRVFQGWKEGRIYFPPTYKYSFNSDRFAGDLHPKEKRRTPAWCDRILWFGGGLQQLSYVRGESRFSDHRPVYSVFNAEIRVVRRTRIRRNMGHFSSRIEVEELLPHPQGYCEMNLY